MRRSASSKHSRIRHWTCAASTQRESVCLRKKGAVRSSARMESPAGFRLFSGKQSLANSVRAAWCWIQNKVQLMSYLDRHFSYFAEVEPRIAEALLLIPLLSARTPLQLATGTNLKVECRAARIRRQASPFVSIKISRPPQLRYNEVK